MHSALYQGNVEHLRTRPVRHAFRYPVTLAYIDLAEVPMLRASLKLFGDRRWQPLSFCEDDHRLTGSDSLDSEIRLLVANETGLNLAGPIRLLTLLRTWGYYFSPLNLYYCFDETGDTIQAIVAEVSNTPWRECHRYVLHPLNPSRDHALRFEHAKDFHVSPFMAMNQRYRWSCSPPADDLHVRIVTNQAGKNLFVADMTLQRQPLTDRALAWSLCRYPWMTCRIILAIYWQALRLWWKKCPSYTHPKKLLSSTEVPRSSVPTRPDVPLPKGGCHPQ